MEPPRRLSDFPWVTVHVACKLCPRRGRYRLARLAARLGPETELDRVLELLAVDCQWMRPGVKVRNYEARCGIRFVDLDKGRPPPPDEPPTAPAALRVVQGGRRG